jgi:desulfoferrodoxin (superoxide reductase-like protein)
MTYFHVEITIEDEAGMMQIRVSCCTIYMPLTKLKQIAWYTKISAIYRNDFLSDLKRPKEPTTTFCINL